MSRPAQRLIIPAAVAAVVALIGVATPHAGAAQPAGQKPQAAAGQSAAADPGKAVFETQCSNCHELRIATGQRKTEEGWATTVDAMVAKGAPVTAEQADQIIAYLAKTYPAN